MALKTGELAEDVLRTMDKAIPSLLFFELTFEDRVKFAAAYKRPNEANSRKNVVEAYFDTPWQPANQARPTLPVALDLAALYEQMLQRHMLASHGVGSPAGGICKPWRIAQPDPRERKRVPPVGSPD